MTANPLLWDTEQKKVFDACVPGALLSVLGAAGSGKTAVLRECVARVYAQRPDARIAVLTPDRKTAGAMRNELSNLLGGLNEQIEVRSISAFAYSIVAAAAQKKGRRAPELISGPDQDAILKDIFDLAATPEENLLPEIGEAALADSHISLQTAQLPAFRAEIRDLITRAAELGLSVQELERLGQAHQQPLWVYGARVMKVYEAALASQAAASSMNPDRVDHARIITMAVAALAHWEEDSSGDTLGGALELPRPHWDMVFVDDLHNATLAVRALLQALADDGASIITFGNPDQGVEGYRGGIAQLPAIVTYPQPSGIGASKIELKRVYRSRGHVAQVIERVTEAIPVTLNGGIRNPEYVCDREDSLGDASEALRDQRESLLNGSGSLCNYNKKADSAEDEATVRLRSFPNDSEEAAYVAQELIRLHSEQGVPYSRMAIITRSGSQHEAIRHIMRRYGVPVSQGVQQGALRDQPAVAAIVAIAHLALGEKASLSRAELRAQAESALTSRLINIDPLRLRRLARQIQSRAVLDGQSWREAQVWEEFAINPAHAVFSEEPLLQPLITAVKEVKDAWARNESAGQILWKLWSSLGVAERWREDALGDGEKADQANADLDSVIQLFRAAQRLEERDITSATFDRFMAILQAQDLPEDSVALSGQRGESVALTTPSGSVGQVWDHVMIMGMNDGIWPNTRLRNPLTHVPELVNVVVASVLSARDMPPEQRRSDVIHDEMRLLLQALSRAEKSVLISCVQADNAPPSIFMQWIESTRDKLGEQEKPYAMQHIQETVRVSGESALVGELRSACINSGDPALVSAAQDLLERLAQAGIRSANPRAWADNLEITGVRHSPQSSPLKSDTESQSAISVSPSRVESILACPLKAFFDLQGGQDDTERHAAELGTLIHGICQKYPHGSYENMEEELEAQWSSLEYEPGTFTEIKARESAKAMLRYMAQRAQDPETPQGVVVEKAARYCFKHHGQDVAVNARLDRIEFNPDTPTQVWVADIKTGSNNLSKKKMKIHPQLLIYQWLVNKDAIQLDGDTRDDKLLINALAGGGKLESEGAKLLFVKYARQSSKAEGVQDKADEEQMELAERMVCASASVLQRSEYMAAASAACRSCAYTWLCPAQEGERVFS